jgi:hypothetical protein
MKNVFKVTNDVALFATPRSGSTALVGAILEKYHPDLKAMADNAIAPEGRRGMPQSVAPRLSYYNGETIVLPVRDPVERFRSAFAIRQWLRDYTGDESVDQTLDIIEAQAPDEVNPHFRLQSVFFDELKLEAEEVQLFQFPRDISELASALTLDTAPEPDHVSETKPDLTPEQLTRVQAIYADDIAFYDSIAAGQVWAKPPTPVTDDEVTAMQSTLWTAYHNHSLSQLDENSRCTVLSLLSKPDSTNQQFARATDVMSWWEAHWLDYGINKTALLTNRAMPAYTLADAPWSIWEVVS